MSLTICEETHVPICFDYNPDEGCPLCQALEKYQASEETVGTLEGERNELKGTVEDLNYKIERLESR